MSKWGRHLRFTLATVAFLAFAFPSTASADTSTRTARPTAIAGLTATAVPRGTLVSGTFVSAEQLAKNGQVTPIGGSGDQAVPMWWCATDCRYITNVARRADSYFFVTQVAGRGPQTLTLSFSSTVSNGWSATGGISAGAVSAGLGFSVTQSQGVTYSSSVSVPYGYCWRVVAYNQFATYGYDVMNNPFIGDAYWVGNGTARRFLGVYYGIYWC
jgi:hypothetical protein